MLPIKPVYQEISSLPVILSLDFNPTSSSPLSHMLKNHFSSQQATRLIQLNYLQDLRESGAFHSDFIREYEIPSLSCCWHLKIDDSSDTTLSDHHVDHVKQYDLKFITQLIELYPNVMDFLWESIRDPFIVRLAIEKGWSFPEDIDEEIEMDKQLMMKSISHNIYQYLKLSENAQNQFTLNELFTLPSMCASFLLFIQMNNDEIQRVDRNVLIDAIQRGIISDSMVKCFLNEKFDREIVLEILKKDRSHLSRLKDVFDWKNDELALNTILFSEKCYRMSGRHRIHVSILECLSNFKDDRDFVMKIIEHDPESFQYCSDRLRMDKEIAIKAIEKNEYMIDYVHPSLTNDRSIIMTAITKNSQFYGKASKELKNDKDLIIFALNSLNPQYAAQHIPTDSLKDPQIMKLLIQCGYIHHGMDYSQLKRDEIIQCLSVNGYLIYKFTEQYEKDDELIIAALKQSTSALSQIPNQFRTFKVLMEAIKIDAGAISYAQDCPFVDDLITEAMNLYPKQIPFKSYHLPSHYRFDIEKFHKIMELDRAGDFYKFIPEVLRNDREIALIYVKRNGSIYKELSEVLKQDSIIRREAIKHGLYKKPFIPLK